jgi:Na+/melibiose symporter-like transporter
MLTLGLDTTVLNVALPTLATHWMPTRLQWFGGAAVLAAFLVWERRSAHPLIDLSLFSNRDFTVGTALATVANFALFGLLFVLPQYFQDVGGADPLGTGVRLLPMIGGMIVATRVGPLLVNRAGARFVILSGLALLTVALGLAATTEVDTAYAFAALWITLLGAGIGLVLPASVGAAIGALSPDRAGSGSGLMQALRQVGGTIGIAVLGTVLSSGYHARLDGGAVPSSAEDAVRSSVGAGIEAAHRSTAPRWRRRSGRRSCTGWTPCCWPPQRLRSWVP